MKSIYIFLSVLVLVITATKNQSQNKLSYAKDKSFKDKEPHLNFLESSIHHHLKKSLKEAEHVIDQMTLTYLHFEVNSKGRRFPFVEEANELRKVAHLIPILQKTSTIKSWNLGHSVRFSEIKDKISESAKKLNKMLGKGHDMVRKMVSNPGHSRFIAKSLFSTFCTFVSVSSTTKVYTELLESINLTTERSKTIAKIATEAANTAETSEGKHENEPCTWKIWGSECDQTMYNLECINGRCKDTDDLATREKKKLGQKCTAVAVGQDSECESGLACKALEIGIFTNKGFCLMMCPEGDPHEGQYHGLKQLNDVCKNRWTQGSECACGLMCLDSIHRCVFDTNYYEILKGQFVNIFNMNKGAISAGLQEAKEKNIDSPIKDAANDESKASFFKDILAKFKDLGKSIEKKLSFVLKLVNRWVQGFAVGIEVEGTLTALKGSASLNLAFPKSGKPYIYGEACGGIQFNFGASVGVGLVITIFHEEMGHDIERTSSYGVSLEIEFGGGHASIGMNLNMKKKGADFELSSISIAAGVGVGASVLPASIDKMKCTAKKFEFE